MSSALTLYSTKQVRELDQIAIKEFGIPGFTLMQRAAQATFVQMNLYFPNVQSICVVCGTGNNGGDGFLLAALAVKAGLKVSVIQLGDENKIIGDASSARQTYLEAANIPSIASPEISSEFDSKDFEVDIIIDAIFGTGLTREVEGNYLEAIQAINQSCAKVIAIDVPSGLHSDSGIVLGDCVKANLTVTFIGRKSGLVTGQARDYVGQLAFDDLEIPESVYQQLSEKPDKFIIPQNIVNEVLPPRSSCSHKGNFGHVLLIGGAPGMSGAIRLAGEAALRAGAGLVTIATHPEHAAWLNLSRPELMITSIEQSIDLIPLLDKVDVIAIGPGLGTNIWSKKLLETVLKSVKPKILDADALNILAGDQSKDDHWILTPHPAEAARLNQSTVREIEHNRYQSVQSIQDTYGGICVLKGAGTLVAGNTQISVCTAGNPGMASGGMGDVLTGIIAGVLSQMIGAHKTKKSNHQEIQNTLEQAALTGVWIHATCADKAAKAGERGLLASDLFPFMKSVIN